MREGDLIAAETLDFYGDGAAYFLATLNAAACSALALALAHLPVGVAGVRIGAAPALRDLLGPDGAAGSIAAGVLGSTARAVRAVLFDKTGATNWSLGWHQDRTIVVRQRASVDGFGPWTVKSGLVQVEPPFAILERMPHSRAGGGVDRRQLR